MRPQLRISEPVQNALSVGRPVVALESTVIAHGLPQPTNLELARRMEAIVRDQEAEPATICILRGELCVGLTEEELVHLASAPGIRKASCRDLPIVIAARADAATTVAATATIASMAGISVFATGGIGGVHRDRPHDVSNDLAVLASTPLAVVCSGAKSILDLPGTLEWLEMAGVPVLGFGTDEFPAFLSRRTGLRVAAQVNEPEEVARVLLAARQLGLSQAILVAVPIPAESELPRERVDPLISAALRAAHDQRVEGSQVTPFLLRWLAEATQGATVRANLALLENNALVAARVARALNRLSQALQTAGAAVSDLAFPRHPYRRAMQ